MEAATVQKKKNSISKGKLKKTIKNVLCRPDPVFWPVISEEQTKMLETILEKHKVHIPEFTKLHWNELKTIPKEKRPKPPKIKKVEGLLFGISECSMSLQKCESSAVMIESSVNPQAIVHPILDACVNTTVPVVCITGLRKITGSYFGIPTSCLGIRRDYLKELSVKILEMGSVKLQKIEGSTTTKKAETMEIVMDNKLTESPMNTEDSPQCCYLYRSNNKTRVFEPPAEVTDNKQRRAFSGQDFIEFSDKGDKQTHKKSFKKMIVKRISNNQNRVKVK